MENIELEKLKYPIGKFKAPESLTSEYLRARIDELDELPVKLEELVKDLNEEQLNTP